MFFCTFLDASKAFDRVNYCKLFRMLVARGLPPCIIRVLINMYVTQQACVSWAGIISDYFSVHNGVRQGGVLSSILFCVYQSIKSNLFASTQAHTSRNNKCKTK